MLKEELFPILLEHIDVVRRTKTTLDVLLERRLDGFGTIDSDRNLSEPWTGVTQFTRLNEKPPDGYVWSGGEADKISSNDKWSGMSKAARRKSTTEKDYRETEARHCVKVERQLFY